MRGPVTHTFVCFRWRSSHSYLATDDNRQFRLLVSRLLLLVPKRKIMVEVVVVIVVVLVIEAVVVAIVEREV